NTVLSSALSSRCRGIALSATFMIVVKIFAASCALLAASESFFEVFCAATVAANNRIQANANAALILAVINLIVLFIISPSVILIINRGLLSRKHFLLAGCQHTYN